MALRFRKSFKILPGVRLNFGKRSASVSLGGKWAGTTVGTRGVTSRVSAPGTGFSYVRRHGRGSGEGSSNNGIILAVIAASPLFLLAALTSFYLFLVVLDWVLSTFSLLG